MISSSCLCFIWFEFHKYKDYVSKNDIDLPYKMSLSENNYSSRHPLTSELGFLDENNLQYSSYICDQLKCTVDKRIVTLQSILKNIQLWEELNRFSELGTFGRDFIENDLSIWLNYSTDEETNNRIEECLKRIPFEQAYCNKNPEFHTKSRGDILREVFNNNESLEWRDNPSLVRNLSIQDKLRIIKRFEYMCYFVINQRDELIYDICKDVLCK